MTRTHPDDRLPGVEARIGAEFRDKNLLALALVHSSYGNENPDWQDYSNERLEFLGDGYINFITAHRLYEMIPEADEGELTARRSYVVRRETLARVAASLGLGESLVMGKGEEAGGGRDRASNLANAFEALAGALLLDRGHEEAKARILAWLDPAIKRTLESEPHKDPKSILQELLQSEGREAPSYRTVEAEGVGATAWFTVEVWSGKELLGSGAARRKVDAERAAAISALELL